jgi:hypothetical protein
MRTLPEWIIFPWLVIFIGIGYIQYRINDRNRKKRKEAYNQMLYNEAEEAERAAPYAFNALEDMNWRSENLFEMTEYPLKD